MTNRGWVLAVIAAFAAGLMAGWHLAPPKLVTEEKVVEVPYEVVRDPVKLTERVPVPYPVAREVAREVTKAEDTGGFKQEPPKAAPDFTLRYEASATKQPVYVEVTLDRRFAVGPMLTTESAGLLVEYNMSKDAGIRSYAGRKWGGGPEYGLGVVWRLK